jgi:NADH dehydrogenase
MAHLQQASQKLVTVIGGSGFLGRYIVRALAHRGYRVRVAVRRPDLAGHLQPLGTVGQIMAVQANVRFPDSLAAACRAAHAVVNLTGILHRSGAQTFEAVHVAGAEAAAGAARQSGARLFIQCSSIAADSGSSSVYARTKAEGEARARAAFQGAIILRPTIVFGPEDQFFNRFAAMSRFLPALPLIGGGRTRFQPVYVGDIASAVATLVERGIADGRTYELGGPEVFTFRELMQFMLKTVDRRRALMPLPFFLAKAQALFLQLLPNPMLTVDQVELLKSDTVVSEAAHAEGRTLEGLGIRPQAIEAIVPAYLYRYRRAGQFSGERPAF